MNSLKHSQSLSAEVELPTPTSPPATSMSRAPSLATESGALLGEARLEIPEELTAQDKLYETLIGTVLCAPVSPRSLRFRR